MKSKTQRLNKTNDCLHTHTRYLTLINHTYRYFCDAFFTSKHKNKRFCLCVLVKVNVFVLKHGHNKDALCLCLWVRAAQLFPGSRSTKNGGVWFLSTGECEQIMKLFTRVRRHATARLPVAGSQKGPLWDQLLDWTENSSSQIFITNFSVSLKMTNKSSLSFLICQFLCFGTEMVKAVFKASLVVYRATKRDWITTVEGFSWLISKLNIFAPYTNI